MVDYSSLIEVKNSSGFYYKFEKAGLDIGLVFNVSNEGKSTKIEKAFSNSDGLSGSVDLREKNGKLIATLIWSGIPKDSPARYLLTLYSKRKIFSKEDIIFEEKISPEYKKFF